MKTAPLAAICDQPHLVELIAVLVAKCGVRQPEGSYHLPLTTADQELVPERFNVGAGVYPDDPEKTVTLILSPAGDPQS